MGMMMMMGMIMFVIVIVPVFMVVLVIAGEARDVLERVITCDRADVPAVARRDQLVRVTSGDRSTETLRQWLEAAEMRPASLRSRGIEID